jgi:hypothetical protein
LVQQQAQALVQALVRVRVLALVVYWPPLRYVW